MTGGQDTDGEFNVEECRRRCENSIRNTATGWWLGRALQEIERLRKELEGKK